MGVRASAILAGMRVIRIFTGDDERSHFEEMSLPLTQSRPPAELAAVLPVTTVIVNYARAGAPVGLHNPPRRQMVVNLSGVCEIDCVDGTRTFGPGDLRFAEDRDGEGHVTRVVEDTVALILPFPDDFDVSSWRL
jgi:hypothetical protein